ncbi:MAG TPA: N,N-dimethylformamidase beta subunit family domain-containing protein [Gaiellaceae bacterium]|nr:N,N-dimethylformamidase beta subunit family domain-containing protein [Gaiellaceae bacterium]
MLSVAAATVLMLAARAPSQPALALSPQIFSPRVEPLTISASLPSGSAGIRLVSLRGRVLGWIVEPLRRASAASLERSWDGRVDGRPLPDGYYRAQLVRGRRVLAQRALRIDTVAPTLSRFRASDGGTPFAGDGPLLTTISPDGDGVRDQARIAFTLDEPARVDIEVAQTQRAAQEVASDSLRLPRGRHVWTWSPPPTTPARTYLLEIAATDQAGNTRSYGAETAYVTRYAPAPVVRVLGIDAAFAEQSYAPGDAATLRVSTDAPSFTMQLFRVGGEAQPSYLADEMSGVPVDTPIPIGWASHRDAPATIRLRIGPTWETGVYYAELRSPDGRVGYAPFVLRPAVLGAASRVAVVMPTNTWQAYNFEDANGDGWGDTWYAGRDELTVALDRPFLNRGVPPRFQRYETPFLNWLARFGLHPDFLTDGDVARMANGAELAALYDLVVYPTHAEYVTEHEYTVVQQFRDAGGNLVFLSANNFFRRVVETNGVLRRAQPWRALGRPEAALVGAQYRANDEGQHQGVFVVRNTAAAPWLWEGTGLEVGSTFGEAVGGYGIEIDATTPDSPPGTAVLADIPDLLGPGLTAQMTYYETPAGAKVFDAGTLDFVGSALTFPVSRLLLNLWQHLSAP